MLEAFSSDQASPFKAVAPLPRQLMKTFDADIAVKIVVTDIVDAPGTNDSANMVARSVVHTLEEALSNKGVRANVISTARPPKRPGIFGRLTQALHPSANLSPAHRLEMALLKLAGRFEDRRVLVVVSAESETAPQIAPLPYEEAARHDVEILALSIRSRSSGTAAVLIQKGFQIQMSGVTEISARDISALLCRSILNHQN